MFDLRPTDLPGCVELQPIVHHDERGRVVKILHAEFYARHGLAHDFVEQLYVVSKRGVLRGLHFQSPPHDHEKLVYCVEGQVMDVVVDLRRGSPGFGRHAITELSAEQGNLLYVPRGLAHAYFVRSEQAIVVYNTTSLHAPDHDHGIRWDSAGIPWPESTPILSPRDARLPPLGEFASPFTYPSDGASDSCFSRSVQRS